MKRPLNSVLPAVALTLLLALCLGACTPKRAVDRVAEDLNLSLSNAREIAGTDSHGGPLGDGTTYFILNCPDGAPLEQIKADHRWHPLPMDETTQILAYGYDDGTTSIGPYLGEVELPVVRRGYYCLIDRSSETQTDLLDRNSFNFTLGIYDSDTNMLYYCKVDT